MPLLSLNSKRSGVWRDRGPDASTRFPTTLAAADMGAEPPIMAGRTAIDPFTDFYRQVKEAPRQQKAVLRIMG